MIAALNAESDRIAQRLKRLHQEMMRQPMEERRANWHRYYQRLAELMERQDEVTQAMTTLLCDTLSPRDR
jgi:thiamine kinase-like enzyme